MYWHQIEYQDKQNNLENTELYMENCMFLMFVFNLYFSICSICLICFSYSTIRTIKYKQLRKYRIRYRLSRRWPTWRCLRYFWCNRRRLTWNTRRYWWNKYSRYRRWVWYRYASRNYSRRQSDILRRCTVFLWRRRYAIHGS